jgi:hypothetical protein
VVGFGAAGADAVVVVGVVASAGAVGPDALTTDGFWTATMFFVLVFRLSPCSTGVLSPLLGAAPLLSVVFVATAFPLPSDFTDGVAPPVTAC